jgi:hypothetical protein
MVIAGLGIDRCHPAQGEEIAVGPADQGRAGQQRRLPVLDPVFRHRRRFRVDLAAAPDRLQDAVPSLVRRREWAKPRIFG